MSEQNTKVWSPKFTNLVSGNTVFFFGFYMLMPTLPLYIAANGGTSAEVGAVSVAFSIASIVTRMLSGYILARFGKKKMLLFAVMLSALVTLLYTGISALAGIIFLRVFQGVGFGFVSTVCATLAADVLPDSRRGEGIGYFGMGTTLAVAFSPTIGLWCSSNFGFNPMFVTSAVSMLVSFAILAMLKLTPQENNPAAFAPEKKKMTLVSSLFEPAISFQCVLLVLFGICRGAESNFLSLLATEYAIAGLSFYYIVQTAVSFVIKFVTGRVYDRVGHKGLIIPGGICSLIYVLLVSFARTTPVLIISGVFSGAAVGILIPTIQTWTVSAVPAERRSVASATYYNFYDIGMGFGALILGNIALATGYSLMFRWSSLAMAAFLIIYLIYIRKRAGKEKTVS